MLSPEGALGREMVAVMAGTATPGRKVVLDADPCCSGLGGYPRLRSSTSCGPNVIRGCRLNAESTQTAPHDHGNRGLDPRRAAIGLRYIRICLTCRDSLIPEAAWAMSCRHQLRRLSRRAGAVTRGAQSHSCGAHRFAGLG